MMSPKLARALQDRATIYSDSIAIAIIKSPEKLSTVIKRWASDNGYRITSTIYFHKQGGKTISHAQLEEKVLYQWRSVYSIQGEYTEFSTVVACAEQLLKLKG